MPSVLNPFRRGSHAKRNTRRRLHAPLITIAVPAYNRPALLAETLASIAAQTAHVALEVIVCDDGAMRETREVVERYSGEGFRYHANKVPLGAVGNWNQCLRMARGKWVMVLHEDDTLYPWYLDCVLPLLGTGAVAVCTKTSRGAVAPAAARPRFEPAVRHYPPRYFLKSSMTPFPGVLVRRDIALSLRGFDEAWGPIADYEFWYRLSCAGRIDVVRAVGAFYRVGPGQWTERIWGRMIGLTHLLRLKIAREQFPESRKTGRWLARFFSFRNAGCYAQRFKARPQMLRRCLSLGCVPLGRLPTGWVWGALKFASRGGNRIPGPLRMQGEPHRFSRVAEDLVASLRRIPSEDAQGSRRRPTRDLSELVDLLRSKHGIGRPTAEQAIRDQWKEIVGPANASYSNAVRIDERGRLVVHVSHSVVRNEFFLNRAEIVGRIRKIPGCGSIKQLHLSQG